jgi:hypothetical protein
MVSTIITVLLVSVMLSIIVSLVIGAMRSQKQRARLAIQKTDDLCLSQISPVIAGSELRQEQLTPSLPAGWYHRHRTIVSGALMLMVLLALFAQSGLADGAFKSFEQQIGAFSVSSNPQSIELNTQLHPLPSFSAAEHVVRVDSGARDQYYTEYEWQVWSYSSCSGISMEMVIDAYGYHYIAADFLRRELSLGIWNVAEGLTGGEAGIAEAASYFGFRALPDPPRTLQSLIATVNKGYPVIVGNPAHIMVVRGADNTYVYVADSSPADRVAMTYAQFMAWWDGFSVVLVPR